MTDDELDKLVKSTLLPVKVTEERLNRLIALAAMHPQSIPNHPLKALELWRDKLHQMVHRPLPVVAYAASLIIAGWLGHQTGSVLFPPQHAAYFWSSMMDRVQPLALWETEQ